MTRPDLLHPPVEATPLRLSGDRIPTPTEHFASRGDERHRGLPAALLCPGSRPDTRSSPLDLAFEWLIHTAASHAAVPKILKSP